MKTIKMTSVRNSNMVEKYYIDFLNTTYLDWIELTKELLKDMRTNNYLSMDADDVDLLFHDEFDNYRYNDSTIIETIIRLLDSTVDQEKYSLVFRFEEVGSDDEKSEEYVEVKLPLYLVVEVHKNKRVATLINHVIAPNQE
jgi:hypothetical protein